MDIALVYSQELQAFNLLVQDGKILTEEGLRTAVVLSLFTDARALADDDIPSGDQDPRGWWGDAYAQVPGDRIGSRLWLLSRSKKLPRTAQEAKSLAEEALAWLVQDRIASSVSVEAVLEPRGAVTDLSLGVKVYRPGLAPSTYRFQNLWTAEARRGTD